jgi:hypothetical protein
MCRKPVTTAFPGEMRNILQQKRIRLPHGMDVIDKQKCVEGK